MNIDCRAFTRDIEELLDASLPPDRAAGLRRHAAACGGCSVRLQAAEDLQGRLRSLPAPEPAPGYVSRVLAAVRAAGRTAVRPPIWQTGPGLALAAALAAAVSIWAWHGQDAREAGRDAAPLAGTPTVRLALGQVEPVRLVFRSPRALDGVTVSLHLPEGVELDGFPQQREIHWQADLAVGTNTLELPVIVRSGDGGFLMASLRYGQSRRQLAVQVQSRHSAVVPVPSIAAAAAVPEFSVANKEVEHA